MDPEACSQCIARGSVCSYRPPKSRGRPNKKQPLHRVIDTKHSIGRPNIACDACRMSPTIRPFIHPSVQRHPANLILPIGHSKVKCTMDPAGCSRCTRRHYHCSYPARNNHGGRPSTEEEAQRRDRGREEWRSGSGWGKSGGGAEGAGIADPSLLVGVDDLIAGDAPVGFVAPGVKSKAAGAEVSSGHGGVEWDRGGDGIRPAGRYRRLLPKLAYPEGPGMFFG